MQTSIEDLQAFWIAAGHGKPWNCKETYREIPHRVLPVVPDLPEDLHWLDELPPASSSTLDTEENQIDGLSELIDEAAALGLHLPEAFVRLLSDPELQEKIPTCTGCSLQLSDSLVPVEGHPGRYVLRFLNDSQFCYMWYLVLEEGLTPCVIASDKFFERDIFNQMTDEENDFLHGLPYEEVWRLALLCCRSFTEFLYRFAIENSIWFARHDKRPLTAAERDYLDQIPADW